MASKLNNKLEGQLGEQKQVLLEDSNSTEEIYKESIQREYAKYLINNNDNMISIMLNFEHLRDELDKDLEKNLDELNIESYKEKLDKLSLYIMQHNDLLEGLYNNEPNDDNKEYKEVYDELLKAHAFYIQGQVMKLEYYHDKRKVESKNNGDIMANVVGNLIIELNERINKVKDTNIPYKYGVNKEIEILKPDK